MDELGKGQNKEKIKTNNLLTKIMKKKANAAFYSVNTDT